MPKCPTCGHVTATPAAPEVTRGREAGLTEARRRFGSAEDRAAERLRRMGLTPTTDARPN